MKPYTTTIENILPGMIVRATDSEYDGTVVLRVTHTRMFDDGSGRIAGDMVIIGVSQDTKITVLPDPTQSEQDVQMIGEMLSDEKIASMARRSAEQVMAYHKGRPPQQYNTDGIKRPEPTSDQ